MSRLLLLLMLFCLIDIAFSTCEDSKKWKKGGRKYCKKCNCPQTRRNLLEADVKALCKRNAKGKLYTNTVKMKTACCKTCSNLGYPPKA